MNTYKIAVLRHYYAPDIRGDERVRFEGEYNTPEEAQAEIDRQESATYYLDYNESGRPHLLIVDSVTADYIESGRNEDMSNYDWSESECACGECGACCAMMIDQDRDYIKQHHIVVDIRA